MSISDTNSTSEMNAVVAAYNTHVEAETAVAELHKSGFDMKKLSIVGRDYHTDEHVIGYYNTGDRMKYWGKTGAFWVGSGGCCLGPLSLPSPVWDLFWWRDRWWPGSLVRWKAPLWLVE